MPGTDRFFVCRQQGCTPKGSIYGLNTDWISTEEAGGWRFMCPACGTPYNANLSKTGLIPANHLWHLEELAINEAAVATAEHATKLRS